MHSLKALSTLPSRRRKPELRERCFLEEFGSRFAGRSAGGLASAVRSESHIPWRPIRPGTSGVSLYGTRDYLAICLCYRSQALITASLSLIGAMRVPRIIAALLLILALFGTVVGLGTAISS
ncbi:MAG: hypothetical protein WAL36_17660, partial [Pseudolabrys sp.]